jgi:hypothetical protein
MQMIGRKNRNNPFSASRSQSRRSGGVLLLIGVLAGVTVGGGVGVIAASTTKTVTVCANKKTNVLRYAKNGKCTSTETKVLLNQTGADGIAGAKGDTGTAGAKGDTGTAGTAGAKGDTGTAGTAGAKGADGAAGTKGEKGDAGTAAASSPTGFTARSVCGSEGITLCAVGVQGPGRGTIIYVDSTNEIAGYDYLEVAPTDGVFGSTAATGVWSTPTTMCGAVMPFTDCQNSAVFGSGEALNYLGLGTGRAATAAIVARHDAGAVAKNLYAAGVADAYTTATASDWFLPSRDELNEVCKYERNTGQTAGASIVCAGRPGQSGSSATYWSSSEVPTGDAMTQAFFSGGQVANTKTTMLYVRPVRSF